MRLRQKILFLLVFPTVCLGFSNDSLTQTNYVDRIVFDKDSVTTFCRWNRNSCTKEKAKIKVSVVSGESSKLDQSYYYVPSAGRIIGNGSHVVWDLSEVGPGNYSLTVGIGRENVISNDPLTRTVTVIGCPECDAPCSCPSLSLYGPTKPIHPGDTILVQANVSPTDWPKISYHWTTSAGTIINGQNTSQSLIKTPTKVTKDKLTVKVEIGGTSPECNCPTVATEEYHVSK